MFKIGRVCMKIAGRDAGKLGVIISPVENGYVLVDGEVRRKKFNIKHLSLINTTVDITENAPHDEVILALKKAGFNIKEKHIDSKAKEKKANAKEKPKKEKTPVKKKEKVKKSKPKPKPKTTKTTKAKAKATDSTEATKSTKTN